MALILCFGLSGWDVAAGFEQGAVVEPVHPFERGIFDRLKGWPQSTRWITSALQRPLIVSAKAWL
jgi:hypothetical protein